MATTVLAPGMLRLSNAELWCMHDRSMRLAFGKARVPVPSACIIAAGELRHDPDTVVVTQDVLIISPGFSGIASRRWRGEGDEAAWVKP